MQVPYDMLVVAVGEQPATFGVPGIAEHCSFMKEIKDTVVIRQKVWNAAPHAFEAPQKGTLQLSSMFYAKC